MIFIREPARYGYIKEVLAGPPSRERRSYLALGRHGEKIHNENDTHSLLFLSLQTGGQWVADAMLVRFYDFGWAADWSHVARSREKKCIKYPTPRALKAMVGDLADKYGKPVRIIAHDDILLSGIDTMMLWDYLCCLTGEGEEFERVRAYNRLERVNADGRVLISTFLDHQGVADYYRSVKRDPRPKEELLGELKSKGDLPQIPIFPEEDVIDPRSVLIPKPKVTISVGGGDMETGVDPTLLPAAPGAPIGIRSTFDSPQQTSIKPGFFSYVSCKFRGILGL